MTKISWMAEVSSMSDDLPSMTDGSSMTNTQNAGRGPTLNRAVRRAVMAGMIAATSGVVAPPVAGGILGIPHSSELAQGTNQIQKAVFCGYYGCYYFCYGYYCYGRRGR